MIWKHILCIVTRKHKWRKPLRAEPFNTKTCRRCGAVTEVKRRQRKAVDG
jgi:transposase